MTMKHYIIVKFREDAPPKEELAARAGQLFESTTQIPGMLGVKLYQNCTPRDNRYDLMIVVEMEEGALDNFDRSKLHHDWKEQFTPYIAQKTIFDHLSC